MPMKSSEDLNLFKDSNLLLFKGDPVTRKTANAGSFPEPVGVFDLDGKCGSIKKAHPEKKFSYEVYTSDDFNRFVSDFEDLQSKNPFKGGTIVVDSLTSFVKMALRHSLKARGASGGVSNEKGANVIVKKIAGTDIPAWDEYNFESAVLDNLVAVMKVLSKDTKVILIAHVLGTDVLKVEGEKIVFRSLMTAGRKPAVMLPAMFKEIYHFRLKKAMDATKPPTYIVSTTNTDLDYASTMLPLPGEIDVTNCDLYQKIQTEMKKKGLDF